MRQALLLFVAVLSGQAFADAQSYCSSDILSGAEIFSAARRQNVGLPLIQAYRDEILAALEVPTPWNYETVLISATALPYDKYLTFLKSYVGQLEKKIDWKNEKAALIRTMHSVIEAQEGDAATKQALLAEVDEGSLVSFSEYVKTLDSISVSQQSYIKGILPQACGPDGLSSGGIAFTAKGKRYFTFCPGSVLKASVAKQAGALVWTGQVNTEGLQFTAFHELGHLLGGQSGSKFRSMHNGLIRCLKSRLFPFTEDFEDEVIADFWGAVALTAALKENPKLTVEEKLDKISLNLSALVDGSLGSKSHLRIGERKQIVLGEACRYLLDEKPAASDCRLKLSAP